MMNEATMINTINTFFDNELDKNEMYTVEHISGSNGGITITLSAIYRNHLYSRDLIFHRSIISVLDTDIVERILQNMIEYVRHLGMPKGDTDGP